MGSDGGGEALRSSGAGGVLNGWLNILSGRAEGGREGGWARPIDRHEGHAAATTPEIVRRSSARDRPHCLELAAAAAAAAWSSVGTSRPQPQSAQRTKRDGAAAAAVRCGPFEGGRSLTQAQLSGGGRERERAMPLSFSTLIPRKKRLTMQCRSIAGRVTLKSRQSTVGCPFLWVQKEGNTACG